jgi:hypothetical protein
MVFGLPGEGPVVLPESVKSWAGALRRRRDDDSPDCVRRLYASGVLMVLSFRKSGRLAWRPSPKRSKEKAGRGDSVRLFEWPRALEGKALKGRGT